MDTFFFTEDLPSDRAQRRAMIATSITDPGALCSEAEFAALLEALVSGRGALGEGSSELELHMAYKWAERVRLDELMRKAVFLGEVVPDLDPAGEILFAPGVAINASARVAAKNLLAAFAPARTAEARDVALAFVAARLQSGHRVTGEEVLAIIEWVENGLAATDLLNVVVDHPATMIAIGPDGGISVRLGGSIDRSAEQAAA